MNKKPNKTLVIVQMTCLQGYLDGIFGNISTYHNELCLTKIKVSIVTLTISEVFASHMNHLYRSFVVKLKCKVMFNVRCLLIVMLDSMTSRLILFNDRRGHKIIGYVKNCVKYHLIHLAYITNTVQGFSKILDLM